MPKRLERRKKRGEKGGGKEIRKRKYDGLRERRKGWVARRERGGSKEEKGEGEKKREGKRKRKEDERWGFGMWRWLKEKIFERLKNGIWWWWKHG